LTKKYDQFNNEVRGSNAMIDTVQSNNYSDGDNDEFERRKWKYPWLKTIHNERRKFVSIDDLKCTNLLAELNYYFKNYQ
jgi:hypothetical protein